MLVVDTGVAIRACGAAHGFELLGELDLVAPVLLWSEFRSSVHQATWRGQVTVERAGELRARLAQSSLEPRNDPRLDEEAWRIADELGWAKTYDAEFVALASLLECRLVTVDGRLRRGAGRLGFVLTPGEL